MTTTTTVATTTATNILHQHAHSLPIRSQLAPIPPSSAHLTSPSPNAASTSHTFHTHTSIPTYGVPRRTDTSAGPSRCFPFWQEVLACYVTNTNAEDDSGKAKCVPVLEDYYECLHHKKEVCFLTL
jgi:hypothetical protein